MNINNITKIIKNGIENQIKKWNKHNEEKPKLHPIPTKESWSQPSEDQKHIQHYICLSNSDKLTQTYTFSIPIKQIINLQHTNLSPAASSNTT